MLLVDAAMAFALFRCSDDGALCPNVWESFRLLGWLFRSVLPNPCGRGFADAPRVLNDERRDRDAKVFALFHRVMAVANATRTRAPFANRSNPCVSGAAIATSAKTRVLLSL